MKSKKVKTYLTHIEEKRECLKTLKELVSKQRTGTIEYRTVQKQYFALLMLDVARGSSLTTTEKAFIRENVSLLDKYPKSAREDIKKSLVDMGIIDKPKEEETKETLPKVQEHVEYKTFDELFPDATGKRSIERMVKGLKDSYVYLKPAVKMCDKLIDFIQTLKFTVSTPIKGIDEDVKER